MRGCSPWQRRGDDFNLTLNRYAIEPFLYRLSISPSRELYWRKGALLIDLWFDVQHRPTRDGMNNKLKDIVSAPVSG